MSKAKRHLMVGERPVKAKLRGRVVSDTVVFVKHFIKPTFPCSLEID